MKNITLIILVLFLYSCGYSSIYKNQKSQNFKINIVEATGNIEMNIPLLKSEYKSKNDLIFFILLFTYLIIFLFFKNNAKQ